MNGICGARKMWAHGWDVEGWLNHIAKPGDVPPGEILESFCDLHANHDTPGAFGVPEHHATAGDGTEIWWPVREVVIAEFSVEDER